MLMFMLYQVVKKKKVKHLMDQWITVTLTLPTLRPSLQKRHHIPAWHHLISLIVGPKEKIYA